MTKAEVERYIEGGLWQLKVKAQFDYSLANLIGVAFARTQSNSVEFPSLEETYPTIFAEELKKQQEEKQLEELRIKNSCNRFLEFALKNNAKMRKGVEDKTV